MRRYEVTLRRLPKKSRLLKPVIALARFMLKRTMEEVCFPTLCSGLVI